MEVYCFFSFLGVRISYPSTVLRLIPLRLELPDGIPRTPLLVAQGYLQAKARHGRADDSLELI